MFGFNKKKKGNRKIKPKAKQLRRTSKLNLKPYFAFTFSCLFMVAVVFGYKTLSEQTLFPITQVKIIGETQHVDETILSSIVLTEIKQGFFDIDLNKLATAIKDHHWVAQATLRRVWPNTVEILVREHQAVAVWDEKTLMSAHGSLFQVDSINDFQHLAVVTGHKDQAKNLLLAFSQLEQSLIVPDLKIVSFKVKKANEIVVEFDNNLSAVFSMQDKDIQFKRFAALLNHQMIKSQNEQNFIGKKPVKSIDMRYSNGFSVVWKETQNKLKTSLKKQDSSPLNRVVIGKQYV